MLNCGTQFQKKNVIFDKHAFSFFFRLAQKKKIRPLRFLGSRLRLQRIRSLVTAKLTQL